MSWTLHDITLSLATLVFYIAPRQHLDGPGFDFQLVAPVTTLFPQRVLLQLPAAKTRELDVVPSDVERIRPPLHPLPSQTIVELIEHQHQTIL